METDCILCGGCADICPENCIEIMHIENNDPQIKNQSTQQFATNQNKSAILIKDDFLCTRCGLCAKRCPVGAITLYPIAAGEFFIS